MKRVAVAILKSKDEFGKDQYLLIQTLKDFGEYTGFWYPPGGHVEENETDEQTLIRELKEELSINIQPIKLIAETPGDVKDQITAWWECTTSDQNFKLQEEEINDAEYFTKDQMSAIHMWPATKNFFEEYIFKDKIK